MAERITSISDRRGAPIYPWADWTDGTPWKLRLGEDFTVSAQTMRSAITGYASRHGLRVKTAVPDARTVEFQFSVEERDAA